MNDGTYQSHFGQNVDEPAMRKHYEGQRKLEEFLRDDAAATIKHKEGRAELKELLREDSGRNASSPGFEYGDVPVREDSGRSR